MSGAPVALSGEDRAILGLEGPTIVGHVCKVISLEGAGPDVDALRAMIGRRLVDAPLLAYRLGGTGDEPAWVPDPAFAVEDHVREQVLDTGLGADVLGREVARLFAEHLDRDRPLWRLDVLRPAARDTAVLVWRLHHALADGTTAIRLARTVLWDPADDRAAPPVGDGRGPAPRDDERRRRHLAGVLRREFAVSLCASPFDAHVGTRRRIAFATVPLPALHAAARSLAGATVNDAVLAVVAGGLGRWFQALHGHPHRVRVKVPVSLHHDGDTLGNADSWFCFALPSDEPDPVRRLAMVRAATAERKADHDAQDLRELLDGLAHAAPPLGRWTARLLASPRAFALNVSNVVGPRHEVTVLGARVRAAHSIAEVGERHALRIAVTSLADRLCFGFCADPAVLDGLDVLADAVEQAADELVAAARSGP
ncbi:MAG: WS/DGAT domain-containing protein [Pseudonocardia sp.]|nr:WS/DGAT domain-containing protein [Pseudonocardia sp.]